MDLIKLAHNFYLRTESLQGTSKEYGIGVNKLKREFRTRGYGIIATVKQKPCERPKHCKECGKKIINKDQKSKAQHSKREFCDMKCSNSFRRAIHIKRNKVKCEFRQAIIREYGTGKIKRG